MFQRALNTTIYSLSQNLSHLLLRYDELGNTARYSLISLSNGYKEKKGSFNNHPLLLYFAGEQTPPPPWSQARDWTPPPGPLTRSWSSSIAGAGAWTWWVTWVIMSSYLSYCHIIPWCGCRPLLTACNLYSDGPRGQCYPDNTDLRPRPGSWRGSVSG